MIHISEAIQVKIYKTWRFLMKHSTVRDSSSKQYSKHMYYFALIGNNFFISYVLIIISDLHVRFSN